MKDLQMLAMTSVIILQAHRVSSTLRKSSRCYAGIRFYMIFREQGEDS